MNRLCPWLAPYTLADNPEDALEQIAGYLNTIRSDHERAVKEDGEIVGYWQRPEWIDGIRDIAAELERRIASRPALTTDARVGAETARE